MDMTFNVNDFHTPLAYRIGVYDAENNIAPCNPYVIDTMEYEWYGLGYRECISNATKYYIDITENL
jgi:hypothetical protein